MATLLVITAFLPLVGECGPLSVAANGPSRSRAWSR